MQGSRKTLTVTQTREHQFPLQTDIKLILNCKNRQPVSISVSLAFFCCGCVVEMGFFTSTSVNSRGRGSNSFRDGPLFEHCCKLKRVGGAVLFEMGFFSRLSPHRLLLRCYGICPSEVTGSNPLEASNLV